jgi:hypothetical protein
VHGSEWGVPRCRGGELRGWRVATDARRRRRRGTRLGIRPAGRRHNHRGLGCGPRGVCSRVAREPHHEPWARGQAAGGGGTSRTGQSYAGHRVANAPARARSGARWAQVFLNCTVLKFTNF